jgi:hypothetical protein
MGSSKWDAVRSLLLALLFYEFFEASKHTPALVQVNPFANDPYDAIGSIAMQLALFLALLSMLRTFRPFKTGARLQGQRGLIAKGRILGAMAICLTMLSDLVAMIRHITLWERTSAGRLLAGAIVGLLLLSVVECRHSWHLIKHTASASDGQRWPASFACAAGILAALAIYPEQLRQTLGGELVTALAGIAMLYLPLGVLASARWMRPENLASDVVDDVTAVFEGIKARTPLLTPIYARLGRLQRSRWPLEFASWINPRRYRWRLSLFAGIAFGLALVTAELWSDGFTHLGRACLVIAVFVVLQSTAVLTGRALLADPLGLFRNDGGSIPGTRFTY